MTGKTVPLVMIPRYATFTGAGTFSTAPLDVQAYAKARFLFWRGYLMGAVVPPGGSAATFNAYVESSHDEVTWFTEAHVATHSASDVVEVSLTRRWFRIRIVLTERTDIKACGITCWALGTLEFRIDT